MDEAQRHADGTEERAQRHRATEGRQHNAIALRAALCMSDRCRRRQCPPQQYATALGSRRTYPAAAEEDRADVVGDA